MTGRPLRTGLAVVAGATVLAVPAAAGATTLSGSGSSAAEPYMLELFKGYSAIHHNIHFRYNADGGNAGAKDVQAGRSQFAINTRAILPVDSGLTYTKLFLDALCIDVNSSNRLSNITTGSLKDIFLGDDTAWNQVPGSNLGGATIDPIGRSSSAGQYTFFQSAILDGQTQSSNVLQATSDGIVATDVGKNPDAIGYVGLANSRKSHERSLEVNGYACSAPEIRSERYPLFRFDYGVFPNNHPSRAVEQFFSWVQTSAAAGKIINRAGAVAAFNK